MSRLENNLLFIIRKELRYTYGFLRENRSELLIICSGILFLTLDVYHPVWNQWFSSLLYLAVFPLIIMAILRKNPVQYGLGIGHPGIWSFYVIITCFAAAPILYATSHTPAFQNYYRIEHFDLLNYTLITLAALFAQEYFFRGFLLFGLKDKLKEGSILVQMVPFVLTHYGKPELETISTIITGILFGYIAYRGKSFWPVFFIHIFINLFFVAAVNLF